MLKNFFRNEDGQGMVEYALIIALIAIVVIVALTTLGNGISEKFNQINDKLGESPVAGGEGGGQTA